MPPQLSAATFATPEAFQSWLLVEGWWQGLLDPDRVVELLGEEPEATVDQALADPDLVERAWVGLRPTELDRLVQWGGEVLRGSGVDAVVCEEPPVVAVLARTAEIVREAEGVPPEGSAVMLSEVEPPKLLEEAPPLKPRRRRRGPAKKPKLIRHLRGPQGALLDALGLMAGFVGLSHAWVVDSPTELRRQLLLDGLEAGVLRYENLLLPFRALGLELQRDEVTEALVDHADQVEIHPELALLVTAPLRVRLKKEGYDGVLFRRGTTSVLVLPHYYLRRLSRATLWQRICAGEGLDD